MVGSLVAIHNLVAKALDCLAHDAFALACMVHIGCVEIVDAMVVGVLDHFHLLLPGRPSFRG